MYFVRNTEQENIDISLVSLKIEILEIAKSCKVQLRQTRQERSRAKKYVIHYTFGRVLYHISFTAILYTIRI
jgi:hypothetical protein